MGWTLAAADINSDGYSDLVVGAPFAPGAGSQRGMIAILYASSTLQGLRIQGSITGHVGLNINVGCHLPYGITQHHLLPDTSEHAPP